MAEAIEVVGNRVALIGVIVSGVVALNTAVTGCVETDQSRYKYFETAVHSEEQFYKGLFEEYIQATGKDVSEEERFVRVLAIKSMATRPIPTFADVKLSFFRDSSALTGAAAKHIESMQSGLLAAITNKNASGTKIADAAQVETFEADEANSLRARSGGVVVPEVQAKTVSAQEASALTSPNTETYRARVLSAGSASGWDVDVFWCAGGNEGERARDARLAASALAAVADGKGQAAPGVSYGRIRLRPLPEALQGPRSYTGRGYRVVFDNGPGEAAAAQAVLATVNNGAPTQFSLGKSSSGSKWYISVFVCPAADTPATNGAAPAN